VNGIKVVCTDRGQHPKRVLGWLDIAPDGAMVSSQWARHAEAGVPFSSAEPLSFRCRTCRRNIEWRQATARRLYDTLTAADVHTVDVALL
jgi:hypothetical protein